MGRARFLFYTGFINRAAMGRARFLLCTGFIIIFRRFFLSVTRPKPQLGQFTIGTLNHATCDVYLPKAVETLMYGYSFLYCIWNIFSSGFMEALDSKRILNTLKKVLRQPRNALMLQLSLSLQIFFGRLFRQKRRSLIYLQFCEYFLWV